MTPSLGVDYVKTHKDLCNKLLSLPFVIKRDLLALEVPTPLSEFLFFLGEGGREGGMFGDHS